MKRFIVAFTWRTLILAGTASVAWASACADEHHGGALAAGCTLNSDCNSPLVCAFQRCHNACTNSRDCPVGQRCMASDRPFHVCQLDEERKCKVKSDCPVGQVCGVDRECRDECTSAGDCVIGQLCTSGTCADKEELNSNGMLPNAASEDAGAVEGQTCRFNSDCTKPLICLSGTCSAECVTSDDCSAGLSCIDGRCLVPVSCSFADGGLDRRAGGACLYTSQCPPPLSCIQGHCTCECLGTADCEHGFTCLKNRCMSVLGGATSAEIGPAGGSITSADGALVMTLPKDAVDHPVVFSVRKASAWPAGALGTVFEVEPSGTLFNKPVTVQLSYAGVSLGALQPSDLSVATAEGSTWTPLGTNVNDAAKKTVSSTTPHLSVFGLVAFGAPPADGADASVNTPAGGRSGNAGGSNLGGGTSGGGSGNGAGKAGIGGIDGLGGSSNSGGTSTGAGGRATGGAGGFAGPGGSGGFAGSGGFGGFSAGGLKTAGGPARDAGALDCTNGCACLNAIECGSNICCYQPSARSSACISPLVGCAGMVLQ